MAETRTTNLKLAKPALNDRDWHAPLNANVDALDAVPALGALAVTPREIPSASLFVSVAAGSYVKADGTVGAFAGNPALAILSGWTMRVWLTDAGALSNGPDWPETPHVRLATVTAGATTIAAIADERVVHRTIKPTPALDARTATATWGTTERTMLQAVYDAVRNLGSGT